MATGPALGSLPLRNYRIVRELGSGSMGVVYKAIDLRLDRAVALKFLPPELCHVEDYRQRFEAEAKAASALDHVNVGTIHGVEVTDDGRMCIVMAFYDGPTLASKIAGGPLPLAKAIDYGRQIARGLAAAHRKNIWHRDIKPSNIMLTDEGVIKIVDFGVARFEVGTEGGHRGETVGTPQYMSPEQALGEEVDHRTDLWSLGIVLYEMLAGRRPFAGDSTKIVFRQIVHAPVPEMPDHVPGDFAAIVSRALSKRPGQRYSSAEEMDRALGRLEVRKAEADLLPTETKVQALSKRRWLAVRSWLIAGLLSVALAVAGFLAIKKSGAGGPRPDAGGITAREMYWQAVNLIDHRGAKGNLVKAISLLRDCVKRDPSFASAYAELGEAYLMEYWTDQDPAFLVSARESSNRALALNKDLPLAFVTLGMLDDGAGQHDLAIEELKQALQLDPRSAEAYEGLGRVYDSLGRAKDAEVTLEKAVDLSPRAWHTHARLGAFYYSHNRLPEALREYQEVVRLAPENAIAYSNLGAVLLDLWRLPDAIATLEKSAAISPSYSALANLGTAYYRSSRINEAAATYEKALKLNDKDFNLLNNLAICYRRLHGMDGRTKAAYERAERATETYLAANSRDAEALSVLGNLKLWVGKRDEAEQIVRQALTLAPEDSDVELGAATVFELTGRRERAIELVESALKHGARKEQVMGDLDLAGLVKDVRFHV